jgi:hypothetical protein
MALVCLLTVACQRSHPTQSYSDTQLHNQIEYYQYLFNLDYHKKKATAANQSIHVFDTALSLIDNPSKKHRELFEHVCLIVVLIPS